MPRNTNNNGGNKRHLPPADRAKLAWEREAHNLKMQHEKDLAERRSAHEKEIELIKARKEIWGKTVDTQMHFNDMSAKSRQLGLSLVVAALGLAAVLLYRKDDMGFSITIFGYIYSSHISGILVLSSAFAILAVMQLDLGVYHKMLRGAVAFGEDLEMHHLNKDIIATEKGLTGAVSHFSRRSDAAVHINNGKYIYIGQKGGSAANKIRNFYVAVFIATSLIGVFLIGDFLTIKQAQTTAGTPTPAETNLPTPKNSSSPEASSAKQ